MIDLFHHHQVGDWYFARLPRYGDKVYYGVWRGEWFAKTESLSELFRLARNHARLLRRETPRH